MPTSDGFPQQWDIVVLPFPYVDRLAEKRRPGLVISRVELARSQGIIWVAMITSAENARWNADVPLESTARTGLVNASVIRPAKIATVDVSRVIRIAGSVGLEEARKFRAAFDALLADPSVTPAA